MPKQYVVHVAVADRTRLTNLITAGTASGRTMTHARILLKADQGSGGPAWPDTRIAEALETSVATVERVRRRSVAAGLDDALGRPAPRREYRRKLDGTGEAQLLALACSAPPAGQQRWSLRLLADKLVELAVVEAIAPNTVRAVLKKTPSSRG